jgi:hypothetical protein
MIYRVAVIGLLCITTACSVPQHLNTGNSTNFDAGLTTPVNVSPSATTSWSPSPQYAPGELFMKEHGDFMLRHEPWRPDVITTVSTISDSEIKNKDGDFNLVQGKILADGRIHISDDGFLNVGVKYTQRNYKWNGAATASDDSLIGASATLGLGYFVNDSTLIEANFQPGVYSDFSGTLHHGDWEFYGNALMTFEVSRNIYFKVGAEHSGIFRDLDAFPVAGVSLIMGPSLRFDLLAPKMARLTANLSDSTAMNLSLDLEGDSYRIRPPASAAQHSIDVQELNASFGLHHRIDKGFSLHGRVGTTLLGDYTWGDGRVNSTNTDGTLEPQLFIEVGFGLDF